MSYTPFPHYCGFDTTSVALPQLYWNVYSNEQRVKALCMEYAKLVVFTDSMVDTINDQYAIIEDMQAKLPQYINEEVVKELQRLITTGELSAMVQAAVTAWANERTAQVDENTQDIATLNGEMIQANADIAELQTASQQASASIATLQTEQQQTAQGLSTEVAARAAADNAQQTDIARLQLKEKAEQVYASAKAKAWSRWPMVRNDAWCNDLGTGTGGEKNVVWTNHGTRITHINAACEATAAHSTADYPLFTVKDGPGDSDTVALAASTFKCPIGIINWPTSGSFAGEFIQRDFNISNAGKLFTNANVFPGKVYIDTTVYGADVAKANYQLATREKVLAALQWLRSNAGTYAYSTNTFIRMGIGDKDGVQARDCSSVLYKAFKAQGVLIPNLVTAQVGVIGRFVTMAEPGQPLDVDILKPGDVIAFAKAEDHDLANIAFGHIGMVDSVDADAGQFTVIHQTGTQGEAYRGPTYNQGDYWQADNYRFVVRYWDDPELD